MERSLNATEVLAGVEEEHGMGCSEEGGGQS